MTNARFGAIALSLGLCLTLPATPARADVLHFDDVPAAFLDVSSCLPGLDPCSGLILNGYEGLNWYDFYVHDYVGGNPAAYADTDSISEAYAVDLTSSFDFSSASLIAVPPPLGGVSQFFLRVTGSTEGGTVQVASDLIPVDADAPQTWNFIGYTGIDTLTFSAVLLENTGNLQDVIETPCNQCYFGIDDLAIEQTPEPASLVLLRSGILALVGAARRRHGSR